MCRLGSRVVMEDSSLMNGLNYGWPGHLFIHRAIDRDFDVVGNVMDLKRPWKDKQRHGSP